MAGPFSTTTMGMEPSPMLQPRLASPTKANGRQAPDGSTMTRMDGSTLLSPITSNGARKITSGAENAVQAIGPTVAPITTEDRRQSSTITTTMAPLPM